MVRGATEICHVSLFGFHTSSMKIYILLQTGHSQSNFTFNYAILMFVNGMNQNTVFLNLDEKFTDPKKSAMFGMISPIC